MVVVADVLLVRDGKEQRVAGKIRIFPEETVLLDLSKETADWLGGHCVKVSQIQVCFNPIPIGCLVTYVLKCFEDYMFSTNGPSANVRAATTRRNVFNRWV